MLSPSRRASLYHEIRQIASRYEYVSIGPKIIDERVRSRRKLRKLNYLEAEAMAEIITKLRPDVAYVDASDVDARRYGRDIEALIPFKLQIISEHHADARYPVVSAASIMAKVERDRSISQLKEKYGDFGSGYASDPRTLKFLEDWYRRKGMFPEIVRTSWRTLDKIRERVKRGQIRLQETLETES